MDITHTPLTGFVCTHSSFHVDGVLDADGNSMKRIRRDVFISGAAIITADHIRGIYRFVVKLLGDTLDFQVADGVRSAGKSDHDPLGG